MARFPGRVSEFLRGAVVVPAVVVPAVVVPVVCGGADGAGRTGIPVVWGQRTDIIETEAFTERGTCRQAKRIVTCVVRPNLEPATNRHP